MKDADNVLDEDYAIKARDKPRPYFAVLCATGIGMVVPAGIHFFLSGVICGSVYDPNTWCIEFFDLFANLFLPGIPVMLVGFLGTWIRGERQSGWRKAVILLSLVVLVIVILGLLFTVYQYNFGPRGRRFYRYD